MMPSDIQKEMKTCHRRKKRAGNLAKYIFSIEFLNQMKFLQSDIECWHILINFDPAVNALHKKINEVLASSVLI